MNGKERKNSRTWFVSCICHSLSREEKKKEIILYACKCTPLIVRISCMSSFFFSNEKEKQTVIPNIISDKYVYVNIISDNSILCWSNFWLLMNSNSVSTVRFVNSTLWFLFVILIIWWNFRNHLFRNGISMMLLFGFMNPNLVRLSRSSEVLPRYIRTSISIYYPWSHKYSFITFQKMKLTVPYYFD